MLCLSGLVITAQEADSNEMKTFQIGSSLLVDNVANLHGGIQTGVTSLALFEFSIEYMPFRKGIFRETRLHGHLLKTGGEGPSEKLIGDVQIASNIEGRASRFIYELYLSQQLGNFSLSAGLHDLNTVFMTSEYAGDFINSSFGIFPAVSLNVPVSIFPVTSFGVIADYSRTNFGVTAGMYNLNHDYVVEDEFTFENHFYRKGYMAVTEVRYHRQAANGMDGEYKLGAYFKDCIPVTDHEEEARCDSISNYGIYFIADQELFRLNEKSSVGSFLQIGRAPSALNYAPEYYGLGISLRSISRKGLNRTAGIAAGHVVLQTISEDSGSQTTGYETVIEFTASLALSRHLTVQPDIQYIVSPSGIYPDAVTGVLRLVLEL